MNYGYSEIKPGYGRLEIRYVPPRYVLVYLSQLSKHLTKVGLISAILLQLRHTKCQCQQFSPLWRFITTGAAKTIGLAN